MQIIIIKKTFTSLLHIVYSPQEWQIENSRSQSENISTVKWSNNYIMSIDSIPSDACADS